MQAGRLKYFIRIKSRILECIFITKRTVSFLDAASSRILSGTLCFEWNLSRVISARCLDIRLLSKIDF